MGLDPGNTLQGGKYTIEKVLSSGITSVSYLAKGFDGERWVIKVLDPLLLVGESDYERDRIETLFIQEAIKLERCSSRSSHIAKAEPSFKENGLICVPVEYVSGASLAKRSRSVLPEAEALDCIRQIGKALTVVHGQDLVHRDIRPSNIFVRIPSGEIVLTNFDLAVDFDKELTVARTRERRDGFSPFELYVPGKKARPCTDVYSLAATLYALLTGEVPTSADERTGDPQVFVLPKGKNPNITDVTAAAIVSGLELLPENRPQTVAEWLAKFDVAPNLATTPAVAKKPMDVPKWSMIWGAVASIAAVVTVLITMWDNITDRPTPAVVEPTVQESPTIPEESGSEQGPDSLNTTPSTEQP